MSNLLQHPHDPHGQVRDVFGLRYNFELRMRKPYDSKSAYVHRHNGLLGTVGIMRAHLKVLRMARSLTADAQAAVVRLEDELDVIERQVRGYRVEMNGAISEIKHKSAAQLLGFEE